MDKGRSAQQQPDLRSDTQDGTLAISGAALNTVPVGEVVRIAPVNQKFWHRFSGSVDLGLTYAKVNGNVQLSSAGGVRYRGPQIDTQLQFSTYLQDQTGSDQVTEHNVSIGAQRDLSTRWSAGVSAQWQQNDELNLGGILDILGGLSNNR